ncbi:MAG: hypothetical protein GVY15_14365 [Bacteroidetes bacterium]|jgi:hypothetical protein|nr:hypothetical protein [Bacteroidota bacterium]
MATSRALLHQLHATGEEIIACLERLPDDPEADAALATLVQQRQRCLDELAAHPRRDEIQANAALEAALTAQDEALAAATMAVEERFVAALQAVDHAHQAHVSYENTHGQPRAILSPDLRA